MGLPICWGPCLKMCSDCYAETILGVANLQGSFLKPLSECYAETILGVANLQGSFFETAFRLLCTALFWGLPSCRGPFLKLLSDFYVEFYHGGWQFVGILI